MPNLLLTAKENAITEISEAAAASLKQLLETKHLYQKVSIPVETILQKVRESVGAASLSFDRVMESALSAGFVLSTGAGPLRLRSLDGAEEERLLALGVENVRLFCGRCDSREAFRPLWYRDVGNDLARAQHREGEQVSLPPSFQLFFVVYQCQSCSPAVAVPEAFIVRRNGWDLFLEGRSPMEKTPVPPFIPKEERGFFRDAIIAHNSGKTLAGLFYLRTFIEQFARRKVGVADRLSGDELLSAYAETIPLTQRDQMPSMREWYDKLSEALHAAKDDAVLFDEAKAEIERHFDFRRLFRIK